MSTIIGAFGGATIAASLTGIISSDNPRTRLGCACVVLVVSFLIGMVVGIELDQDL